jgi:DNA-binding NarL/FixJ family response regulator
VRLNKTSVYLTEGEARALRDAAAVAGRSQSDLIRHGVRLIVRSALEGALDDDPPLVSLPPEPPVADLTLREHVVLALVKAGWSPDLIAEREGLAAEEVTEVWERITAKLDRSTPSAAGEQVSFPS